MELVLLSPAYTALVRDYRNRSFQYCSVIYARETASPKHQHHTPIFTRDSFGSLYIPDIEIVHQGLSSVGCCVCWVVDTRSRQGESIRYWRLRQEKVHMIHHMGAGVVPSSSWVLFIVMASRGACLRNCHLLCGLSHHHRCDALGLWED